MVFKFTFFKKGWIGHPTNSPLYYTSPEMVAIFQGATIGIDHRHEKIM
jgi:hypothetical protein